MEGSFSVQTGRNIRNQKTKKKQKMAVIMIEKKEKHIQTMKKKKKTSVNVCQRPFLLSWGIPLTSKRKEKDRKLLKGEESRFVWRYASPYKKPKTKKKQKMVMMKRKKEK